MQLTLMERGNQSESFSCSTPQRLINAEIGKVEFAQKAIPTYQALRGWAMLIRGNFKSEECGHAIFIPL
jgi:hypothetical protein